MKNLKLMSTKKLNALLETVTDEQELAAIKAELSTRQNGKIENDEAPTDEVPEAPETPADEAPADEAPEAKRSKRMTDEEREAKANELREKFVNHKCQVVPFNTIDWVDGVVVGVLEEKRQNKVLVAIMTDDGRRIVKAWDSKLLKISDEVVERVKKTRSKKEPSEFVPWTPEEIAEGKQKYGEFIGHSIEYVEQGAFGKKVEGEDGEAKIVKGYIVGLVPEKRTKRFMYRIKTADGKIAHKTVDVEGLTISEDVCEEALAMMRVGRKSSDKPVAEDMNELETMNFCAEKLEKAKAQLEKAQANVAKWQDLFDTSKEVYEQAVAEGKTFDEPNEPEETPEAADDELM